MVPLGIMPSIKKLKINVIGAGRVGKALALLLKNTGLVAIQAVCNKTLKSAELAVQFIGQGRSVNNFSDLPPAEIYLITAPDDAISKICQQLVQTHNLPAGAIVIHCSGLLSSDILTPTRSKNCYIASLHPVKSFADPQLNVRNFSGTYCAFEGDEEVYKIIAPMIDKMGGKIFKIDKDKKIFYHLGSVFAANYLTTIAYLADECYQKSGLSPSLAKKLVISLMTGVLINLTDKNFSAALTGPVQRGDVETIKKHLLVLEDHPDLQQIYKELGKNTLEITQQDEKIKKLLWDLLAKGHL